MFGPQTEPTVVTISGYNFVNQKSLACRFGQKKVLAHFISDRRIVCNTTTMLDANPSCTGNACSVRVGVTTNGQEWVEPSLSIGGTYTDASDTGWQNSNLFYFVQLPTVTGMS